ncbi:MAG: iron-sulfur cluster assembly scaffold protein [Pyrinomonadaceae bacterium]
MPYSDTFNDHLAHPRYAGEIPDAHAVAEEVNPVCGDRIRLSLSVQDGFISEARFLAYGCAPTLACGSALVELINGRPVAEIRRLSRSDIIHHLDGLPRQKYHAAALAIEVLATVLDRLNI